MLFTSISEMASSTTETMLASAPRTHTFETASKSPTRSTKTTRPFSTNFADIKTLYLFVRNYNAIIAIWSTIGAICSQRLTHRQYDSLDSPGIFPYPFTELTQLLRSFFLPIIWVTLVTISFSISNQRLPSSIREDSLNKPWRPIPSQLITPQRASTLLMISNIIGLGFSWTVGAHKLYLVQMVVSYLYNDKGGGDSHYVIRDSLNGIGLTTWAFGATSAAKGADIAFSRPDLLAGIAMILAIATTNGIQDFRDLYGDRKCGRGTLPLLVGETKARYILAIIISSWSFGIVIILGLPLFSTQTILGTIIAVRLVYLRERKSDKVTTELWYGWSATLLLTLVR
jgi:4-hydroxybenzoate polyprenyltransferase